MCILSSLGYDPEIKRRETRAKLKMKKVSRSFPVPCKGCFSLCSTKCFIYLVKFNSHDTHEGSKLLNSDWDDPDQTHFKSKDVLKGHTSLNLVLNMIQCVCFSCNLYGLFSVFLCPRLIDAYLNRIVSGNRTSARTM